MDIYTFKTIYFSFYLYESNEYMPRVFSCLQRPVEGVKLPETGLPGKLPNLGVEKRTQVP